MKLNKENKDVTNIEEVEKPKRGKRKKTLDEAKENKKELKNNDYENIENDEKDENPMTPIINSLKAKYGKIFGNTTADGDVIIWKPLNRQEYKDIIKKTALPDAPQNIEQMSTEEKQEAAAKMTEERERLFYLREELVCIAAIVYPENAKEIIYKTAGLATILSEDILMHSGFAVSPTQEL